MKERQKSHVAECLSALLQKAFLLLFTVAFLAAFLSGFVVSPLLTASAAQESELSAGTSRVFDGAGLFAETEKESMEEEIASMRKEMNMDVVIVTTDDAEGKSAEAYSEDYYVQGNFGTGKEYSGVLFLIDMDHRELYIAPVGVMNRFLTDKRWNAILDDAYKGAAKSQYAASAEAFLSGVHRYYTAGIPGGQYNYDRDTGKISVYRSIRWYEAAIALAAALLAAAIPCISIINLYAMKKERRQAGDCLRAYRARSRFKFSVKEDELLKKNVTHIIIPKSNSGGRMGGGGSSAGRSTIHSSGGRSFGGGGRKF